MLAILSLVAAAAAFSMDYKVSKLNALAGEGAGAVNLNSELFGRLVSTERNYTVMVVYTSLLKEHGCAFCHSLHPQIAFLAKSWSDASKPGFYFAFLEYKNAVDVFQKEGLTNVPVMKLFFPTTGTGPNVGKFIQEVPQTLYGASNTAWMQKSSRHTSTATSVWISS